MRYIVSIHMHDEVEFRQLMSEHDYHVPMQPLRSSRFPKFSFVIDASAGERFSFLEPLFQSRKDAA